MSICVPPNEQLLGPLQAFADSQTLKRALAALQNGPFRFKRNNVIACEGDTADYIFLVVSGVLRSCKTFRNGDRSVVAFYLPGDLFGWDDRKCPLSVEAATEAIVIFLKRNGLVSLAIRESRVAAFLLSGTMSELRRAQERALLMTRNATHRVAAFLSKWSQRCGETEHINIPMSYEDVADYLGLTIETLSRTITKLEQSKLVTRESTRTLVVRSSFALTALMD